ncbi:type 1 glutamine amidotransferase domain-containing protein [Hymenobacter sp. BT664]|uniref:Type 1 glutamine amidotransferase domain-containing protein n=1 Tax=Hymenobacter montanus TaxID=2771359 RepID=A0A927B9V4_9BACT|nr:type 1 glutamine amidotransferase domain-containing protein [Hymenobacter montanus]MBD2766776.1 type 1 glutamine amidotransferase domain-containing protein [Hymenobacter montanus]
MSSARVLFVVTSHGQKGDTGQPTGYYLPEVAHPWAILTDLGYDIDFVSPQGGQPPADGVNLTDPVNARFVADAVAQQKINNSLTPARVVPSRYAAIYYAGGHGTMWDFAENEELARIAGHIYDRGGIVGAVCHGPAGLVNIRLANGELLVKGKVVSSFTDEEEAAVKLDHVVPFLLETRLKELGAIHRKSPNFQAHVEVAERLVTGQNPASAPGVGEALAKLLAQVSVPA